MCSAFPSELHFLNQRIRILIIPINAVALIERGHMIWKEVQEGRFRFERFSRYNQLLN